MSLTRQEAEQLVEQWVDNVNLRRHMRACEAIMRGLAARLGQNEDEWGLAGLVHDLDVERTTDDFTQHGVMAAEELTRRGAPASVVRAVAAHNHATGVTAGEPIEVALLAADQLSGLITAAALVRPDKSLRGVQPKSVRKRFRETAFARGVDRDAIARCAELDMALEDFMAVGLAAMQDVADELGLP